MAILNEHGPKELFKAYYANRINPHDWDFENSSFKEISKEEAKDYLNEGEGNRLHLIVEGKLVLLQSNGKCSPRTDVTLNNEDNWYTHPDGWVTYRTENMPGEHLIDIADKVYLVDLVRSDSNKRNARAEYNDEVDKAMRDFTRNSFSGKYSPTYARGTIKSNIFNSMRSHAIDQVNTSDAIDSYYSADIESAQERIEQYNELLDKAIEQASAAAKAGDNAAFERASSDIDYYAQKRDITKQYIEDELPRFIKTEKNDAKDNKAAIRNALSMKNLQDRIMSKQKQLEKARQLEDERLRAENELEDIKLNGSQYTRGLRKQAQELTRQIRDVKKKIAALELYLEDTSEDDTQALAQAQADYNNLVLQLDNAQGFIDKLAAIQNRRRNKE